MSASLSLITNTGQNDFITRCLLWSNTVKCSTQSLADRFHTDLCADRSMKAATTAHITVWDISRLLGGESFIFLYINTLFPTLEELLCTDMASQITAEMVSSLDSSSDLWCLYESKYLLPNSPQWSKCYNCLPIFTQHTTNNEKMRPWTLAHRSFVTCTLPHRLVKSSQVIKCG